MKINDIHNPVKINAAFKKEVKQQKTETAKYDSIEIGSRKPKQDDVKVYSPQVKKAAESIKAPSDPERLENLRQQVQNGTYRVSTAAVADAMLSRTVKK